MTLLQRIEEAYQKGKKLSEEKIKILERAKGLSQEELRRTISYELDSLKLHTINVRDSFGTIEKIAFYIGERSFPPKTF